MIVTFKEFSNFCFNFFSVNKIPAGPYTSNFPIKRSIFFNRLNSSFKLLPSDIEKKRKFLDFGCSEGVFILWLMINGFENVVGFDLNKGSLLNAKKLIDSFNERYGTKFDPILTSNIEDFKKDTFSVSFANDVFEHLTKNIIEETINSIDTDYWIINMPSENFIYMSATGFKREPDHVSYWYEVFGYIKECKNVEVKKIKNFMFLFKTLLVKKRN